MKPSFKTLLTSIMMAVVFCFSSCSSDDPKPKEGCTCEASINYDIEAEVDDGTCMGCTQVVAGNYNACASIDDGSCSLIGVSDQGGIIAYIFQPGDPGYVEGETHGLVAATTDQSTGLRIRWNNGVDEGDPGTETGVTATALGTGLANTDAIIASQGPLLVSFPGDNYAAALAREYDGGGFTDWYLPSKDELNILWMNLADSDGNGVNTGPSDPNNLGGFEIPSQNVNNGYWSSSEVNASNAWSQDFSDGSQVLWRKRGTNVYVRAIRTF